MHQMEGVIVDEHVDDIRTAYRQADALLAPISIAGGTKFKILEAMASGCPVITTPQGIYGISGADACVGIARNTEEFVRQAVSLGTQETLWSKRCRSARTLVESMYSWPAIAQKMSDVWEGVMR
jgi:glycosyltransferase involved in cell wall biosynthesis